MATSLGAIERRLLVLENEVREMRRDHLGSGSRISTRTQNIKWLPKLSEIRDVVCAHYQVTPAELFSARRQVSILRPRQIYFYLAAKMTVVSFPQIGKASGDRDHTTVIHGSNRIGKAMESDLEIRREVEALESEIIKMAQKRNG